MCSIFKFVFPFGADPQVGRDRSTLISMLALLYLPAQTAARNPNSANMFDPPVSARVRRAVPAGLPRSHFDLNVGPFAFTRADGSQESQLNITCTTTLYRQGGRRPVPAGQLRSHFDLSADEFSMYHI